jgi:predicted acetyltransferase
MAQLPQPFGPPEGFSDVVVSSEMAAEILALDTWAFPAPQSIEELLGWASPLEWTRARAVRSDRRGTLAAMHASYAFSHFPVPGATLPAAGLTWVGVHPEFRRRGLLTSMIATHLADCRERKEVLSVLTASEPAIYGRFGYGMATQTVSVSVPRGAALRPVAGSDRVEVAFEVFDRAKHLDLVAELHQRYGALPPGRPGWASRETTQLQESFAEDPESLRDGFEAMRILLASTDGEPTGYALFRRKLDWTATGPAGEVSVREIVGLDPATRHALWSRLLNIDLTRTVNARSVLRDDPLLSLLVDLRATQPKVSDNVWVRLVDAPTALRGRRYAAPLDLAITVTDALIAENNGSWHLHADAFSDDVVVSPAAHGEINLDVRELGALYLGGTSANALQLAGLLTGPPEKVQQLTSAFSWPLQPGCSWIF